MEFELRQKVMKDIRKYVGQRAGADNRYKRHSSAVENELKTDTTTLASEVK